MGKARESGYRVERRSQAVRQTGAAQQREVPAQGAQLLPRLHFQRGQDAVRRAEKVAHYRHVVALNALEQQGRALARQAAVAERGYLEPWRNGL